MRRLGIVMLLVATPALAQQPVPANPVPVPGVEGEIQAQPPKVDEKVRTTLGDLALRNAVFEAQNESQQALIAKLQAQVRELQAQLKAAKEAPAAPK